MTFNDICRLKKIKIIKCMITISETPHDIQYRVVHLALKTKHGQNFLVPKPENVVKLIPHIVTGFHMVFLHYIYSL